MNKLPYETVIRNLRLPENLLEKCKAYGEDNNKSTTDVIRDILAEAQFTFNPPQVLSLDKKEKLVRLDKDIWQWLETNATVYGISINELVIRIIFSEFENEM